MKLEINRLQAIILLISALIFWSTLADNRSQRRLLSQYKVRQELLTEKNFVLHKLNDKLVAQRMVLQVETRQALREMKKELDSVKISYKRTESVTKIKTTTKSTVEVPDTVTEITYRDRWLGLSGKRLGGKLTLEIESFDSLSIYTHWKRRLFRADELTVSAVAHNPNTVITGLTSIKVKSRPKRIGIGFFGGVDIAGRPTFGFGVQYSLLRF